MDREVYLKMSRDNVRLPIVADMILHEREDPGNCRFCGRCLGEAIVEAAIRFDIPLAFPLMDLRTEKEWILKHMGIHDNEIDTFHFTGTLNERQISKIEDVASANPTKRMEATLDALRYVDKHSDKIPVGMCIGPFSLMTKFLSDPITAAYQVGINPDDEEAQDVLQLLASGTDAIIRWIEMQVSAGAKAICVCEPAYNIVYISPRQIKRNPSILDMLVLNFNRRIKERMDSLGVDLILHDCGELNDDIIRSFNFLDPAILSLGSPCDLPGIAHLINKNIVIMGNLPSKKFYSDSELSVESVINQSRLLIDKMRNIGHPFILATECDVLYVHGHEQSIMDKIIALTRA
ncbi:MAG: hypothetical protein JXA33_10125 [Anaerolineae bacterium]|nr:hypothetical protein [Anaerolineae bacterium]